jgi:hypothetical protein
MRKIPVSQNLRQAMREERAQLEAEGWSTAGDGRYGVLQARRGAERAQVALCTVAPQDAGYIVGQSEGWLALSACADPSAVASPIPGMEPDVTATGSASDLTA